MVSATQSPIASHSTPINSPQFPKFTQISANPLKCLEIGIVQKVFSEKASEIARMRQKCVKHASDMRQKCVKILGKEERSKMKCVRNARNTFGGEHLLDDTEENRGGKIHAISQSMHQQLRLEGCLSRVCISSSCPDLGKAAVRKSYKKSHSRSPHQPQAHSRTQQD